MRRVIGLVAIAIAATAVFTASPAGAATPADVQPLADLNSAACHTPPAQNHGHASYQLVNGKAGKGTWKLWALATCRDPETTLTVSAQLIHNGTTVKGFAPGGSCSTSAQTPTCRTVSGYGSKAFTDVSGVWIAKWTMIIKGPDAILMTPYCGYDAKKQRAVCTGSSKPIRIP